MSSKRIVDLRGKKPGAPRPAADTAPLPLRPGRRVSPVRARRRKTRLVLAIAVLLLLGFAALGVSYVSYLPRYTIETITVQGAQQVPPDLIQSYVQSIIDDGSHHFLSRANIFLFPEAVIEKDIPLEFPRIQSATVSRPSIFSNAVTITVTERQTAGLWCDGQGNCYDLDPNGFIFAEADPNATTTGEYVFEGGLASQMNAASSTATTASSSVAAATSSLPSALPELLEGNPIGQTFAPGHLPGLLVFLQLLGQAGFSPTGAVVEDDQDFTVPLQEGYSIYASFGEDAETLVQNLQLVLSSEALSGQEQDLEYVDLRFGDKVYYKLNGQGETQAGAQ